MKLHQDKDAFEGVFPDISRDTGIIEKNYYASAVFKSVCSRHIS